MVVAFELVELCLEFIEVGWKQVVYCDVRRFKVYGLKDIAGLIVLGVDVKIMALGMDWSVVGCREFRDVKK